FHALPEGDAAADVGRGLARLRVVPDGVLQHLAVDEQAVVVSLALPWATGTVIAEGRVLPLQAALGKIGVALDEDDVVALGQDGAVPGGFHWGAPLTPTIDAMAGAKGVSSQMSETHRRRGNPASVCANSTDPVGRRRWID